MDLEQLRIISPAIDAEIKQVFAKHGFNVTHRKASTDPSTGQLTWNLKLADANMKDKDGNQTNPEAERYKLYAEMYGLPSDGVGRVFQSYGGKTYTIIGLRGGRAQKTVVAERDGKRFVFDPVDVKRHLAVETDDAMQCAAKLAAEQIMG